MILAKNEKFMWERFTHHPPLEAAEDSKSLRLKLNLYRNLILPIRLANKSRRERKA